MNSKVIEAIKTIKEYCLNTVCTNCCICEFCEERLNASPISWDQEEDEE